MKIDADELTLGALLNRGDVVFYVPVYQRRYDWNQDQWGDLWDDVTTLEGDDSHFIGSIVVIRKAAAVKGFNEMEVVDGQQRLTTISILLCALRDIYQEKGDVEQASNIEGLYLHSKTLREQTRKIKLGRTDDEAYERLLKGQTTPRHNVNAAYEFFKQKISHESDLDRVAHRYTSGLSLVFIAAETPEDAFKLFETLNDRGLELSAVDLIKNNMLSTAAKESKPNLDSMIEAWDEIITNLEELDKIRFFRQFLLSNFQGKVTKSALYENYKRHISKCDDLDYFVLQLCDAAEFYRRIHDWSFDDPRLNFKLEDLFNLKATTSFTLLLKLFALQWPPSQILEVIPSVEAFSLRRGICGWSTSEMDTIYNQIANLPEGDVKVDKIRQTLRGSMPDDAEFYDKFKKGTFRQDSQTKYVLEQFEYNLVRTGEKKIADRQSVHIEHIMPQTITAKKSLKYQGGDWTTYLGSDAPRHPEYFQRIGNLTLLASELNVPASNNPFEAKKGFYKKSEFRITQELCQLNDWRITQIEDRSERLAKQALEIWSI